MALTPGLSPSLRLVPSEPTQEGPEEETIVEIIDGEDKPIADNDGKILEIEHDDGSITITMDGRPLRGADARETGWYDNLVDDIDPMELARIADDLLRGIGDIGREQLDCGAGVFRERGNKIVAVGRNRDVVEEKLGRGSAVGGDAGARSRIPIPDTQLDSRVF